MIGVVQVRVLLAIGEGLFGVYVVLLAGTGLAGLLLPVVKAAVVPSLGAGYHDSDRSRFPGLFNSALFTCIITGAVSLLGYAVLWGCTFIFEIPVELGAAARIYVVLMAVQMLVAISLDPFVSQLVVSGRMVAFNLILLIERTIPLLAAGLCINQVQPL